MSPPSDQPFLQREMAVEPKPNGMLAVEIEHRVSSVGLTIYFVDSRVGTARFIEDILQEFKEKHGEERTGYLTQEKLEQFISENAGAYDFTLKE